MQARVMCNKNILTLKVVAAVVIAGVAMALWQLAREYILHGACLDAGGKWATNGNYCIHRRCAEDNSCKPSYRNNAVCETLKIGISQNELYFHLGMPESDAGDVYYFTGGGTEPRIKAVVVNGVVGELECGTGDDIR